VTESSCLRTPDEKWLSRLGNKEKWAYQWIHLIAKSGVRNNGPKGQFSVRGPLGSFKGGEKASGLGVGKKLVSPIDDEREFGL
jgi:hypothetical protein